MIRTNPTRLDGRPTLRSTASQWLSNCVGNTSLMFAGMLVPIIGLLGGAVDIMRTNSVQADIKAAIDGAALAAASLSQQGDPEAVAREYVLANLGSAENLVKNLQLNISEESGLGYRAVTVEATGQVQTLFLGLLSHDQIDLNLSATAQQKQSKVELSMVLDISSSMRGAKLTNLKTAAETFLTEVFDDANQQTTSVNLVPFGGTVNVGEQLFNRFAVHIDNSELDPDEDDYEILEDVTATPFRFTGADHCLEYQNSDFTTGLLSDGQHGQVPDFWRWWNFHPWCPHETSAAIFNSGEVGQLVSHISGMTLSDGTGLNYGAMWGLKALSPEWAGQLGGDFDDRPAPHGDSDTLKALIIMTDGEITAQFRPIDYTVRNVHTNRDTDDNEDNNGNGFADQGNRANMQTVLNQGNDSQSIDVNGAANQLRRVCTTARANGIVVYTIGFQINRGALSDRLLADCATDPSKYYFVEDLDIQAAFDGISASLQNLRIIG